MPRLSDVSKALYQLAITHWPAAWRVTYELMGKRSVTGPDIHPQVGEVERLQPGEAPLVRDL
jgi:hypothetical protein